MQRIQKRPVRRSHGLTRLVVSPKVQHEAGGIYLFDDESSLQTFLAGPLAAKVKSHPAFSEMSAKQFEVMTDATATTRGPV